VPGRSLVFGGKNGGLAVYELFDHTADLGLRVVASDLNHLFQDAALALTSAMVDDVSSIEPKSSVSFEIAGNDLAFLLFDWLNQFLVQFEIEGRLFSRFEVAVRDDGLTATAWGEPLDRSRHALSREVKAITYHELKVEKTADGWLAEVIVDI
jgi:SHS2 domain-containing protein